MTEIEKSQKTEMRDPLDGIMRWFGEGGWPRWPELRRSELWNRLESQLKVEEYREGDELVVKAEMPGLDPDKDVEIEVTDHQLRIHAERRQETKTEDKDGYRSEFRYGSVSRTVDLPIGTSADDVKASYRDGILEVHIPVDTTKAAAAKVPIQRGKRGRWENDARGAAMTGNRIIVGIDGSKCSRAALEWAADEAAYRGIGVRVVACWEIPLMWDAYFQSPIAVEDAAARMRATAETEVQEVLGRRDVDVTIDVLEGAPSLRLLELDQEADMIVVGTRGRGGFLGLLLGSVSQHLAQHARCPVVIVPSGDEG